MRPETQIWLQTLGVGAAYLATIWLWYERFRRAAENETRALVLAFTVVQCWIIALLLLKCLGGKLWAERLRRRGERVIPEARALLASCSTTLQVPARLRQLYREYPEEVAEVLAAFLLSIVGDARHRLTLLAVELGIVRRWERQARAARPEIRRAAMEKLGGLSAGVAHEALIAALDDCEVVNRVSASRALLRAAAPGDVERVFAFALAQPPLVRALLVDELREYAGLLCEKAIPELLRSRDALRMRHGLELITAWCKTVPLPDLAPLLTHADAELRAAAFQLLRYALPYAARPSGEVEVRISEALDDPDPRVQAAAAGAAGRLQVVSSLPALTRCLHRPDPQVALAAARALASLGRCGADVLELTVHSGLPPAAIALEIFERVKVGRFSAAEA